MPDHIQLVRERGCKAMKLLLIEDDKVLSDTVRATLEDYDVTQVYDGEEGLFEASQDIYDLIILDIMLPLMDGYAVLRELRAQGITTPVLLLTAKDGIDDKIKGFQSGADDYLPKPFHREELQLRIEAILRRAAGGLQDNTLSFHEITLNLKSRTAAVDEHPVELQGKQFDLLEYLMGNQGIILTKEQIFDRIWGFDSATTANVVEVYASNLRKALKPFGGDRYIKTVRGMGYMLTDEA